MIDIFGTLRSVVYDSTGTALGLSKMQVYYPTIDWGDPGSCES